jgi:uncharacterized tellurite resistance protein B-like protein
MIEQIRAWLSGGPAERRSQPRDALPLALCALLIEAANSDDHFDAAERAVIAKVLEHRFNLSPAGTRALIEAGERAAERSAELFHFTRVINERLSPDKRIELIEMLWEVAYADGVLDEFEDSLLRRIAGLIYIPDRERGMARQRVLQRRGFAETI